MTTNISCRIRVGIAILLAIFALPLMPGHGDTVTLKNGTKLEGKITFEAADFIKLQTSRSGSIKETKLIKRSDIQSISKVSPDVVAMEKLKSSLPTPSLMTSSNYESLIKSGPESFLRAFPNSLLTGEAKKILKELNTEKALVDRGGVKLEGEWISVTKRQNFKTLINSRIRIYTMKKKATQRNYTSALRDLQIIEEQYIGTPAYPEAVKVAVAILPSYGQLLTRQLKDVEFLNKKRETNIKLLPPENQARTEAAYKKEQDRFKALADQEKKTGIKWRSVNSRNKDSITPMIDTIRKEIDRLQTVDTAKLEEQAKQLVRVDNLIHENKLKEAQELLLESGGKITSSGKKKTTSRSKRLKTKSSYSAALSKKIAFKIDALEEAAKNATLSDKAKKVAASITQAAARLTEGDGKNEDVKEGEKPKKESAEAALEAAMAARKKAADANKQNTGAHAAAKSTKKPKSTKKKTKPKKSSTASASSGGGLPFQVYLFGFVAIMAIVIVVMKKMGIGGSKEGGEG